MAELRLNDFVIAQDPLSPNGLATYDVKRLLEISDSDFISAFRNEMRIHVKSLGHPPRCSRCSGKVESEDLVRYFGENLHHSCFIPAYIQEREKLSERERGYFDRVVKLIAS